MTDRLYAKYMWLISTIYDAGKISFEDIARKWDDAYINDLHQPHLAVYYGWYSYQGHFFAIAMFYLKKDVSFSLSFSMSSMKSNMNSPKVSSMSPAYGRNGVRHLCAHCISSLSVILCLTIQFQR